MKNDLFSWRSIMKLALLLLSATVAVGAQTATPAHPKSDTAKIADALRAGPPFITKNATLLDWPTTTGGEYRVFRKGTNGWTCLPGVPGYPHDEPGCFDVAFMQWIKDSVAGREPHIDKVGIAYMYAGAWVPNLSADKGTAKREDFHVGPHIMIVSPHQDQEELQSFNRDGSNGMPYVTHMPNGTDLFLVIPIRQWREK